MDAFLRGGLRPYGITELAGEAGAAAMYISTEGQFPQRRFAQIAAALQQRHPEMEAHDFLARVVLESAPTAQRLLEILSTTARPIINRYNVRLLIVDSIAAVFREFGNDEILERAKLLWRIAQQLKFLADGSGGGPRVLVLVTNQVSQRLDGVESLDAGRVVPALGLSWAASVNTRLLVRRTARKTEPLADNTHHSSVVVGAKRSAEAAQLQEDDEKSSRAMGLLAVREMNVAFAPHLPRSSTHSGCCYFIVDRAGVAAVGAPGREGEADRSQACV